MRSEREAPLDAWRGGLSGGVGGAEALEKPGSKLKPGPGKRSAAEVAGHQQARVRAGLLEIIAERGYAGLTVRELAGRAGVSTRSFYQHYPSKEACFLGVHQFVVRRVLRGIEVAALEARDSNQCLRFAVNAIVREWASDPKAARLMLVDAYSAGAPALKQALLASRSIEARIGECLDCASDDASLAPLAAEAMVAGIFTAVRGRLLSGGNLDDLAVPLSAWAAAYHELPPRQIEEMRLSHQVPTSDEAIPSSDGEEEGAEPKGDRGLLLAAAAKLVASRGDADLALEEIAGTAGISRRGFEAEFPDPEACLAAAHGFYAGRAIEGVVRRKEEVGCGDDARRLLVALAGQLAAEPVLAGLCFSDVAVAGPRLIRSHQRFMARLGAILVGGSSAPSPAAQASAGALWGPLRQRVVMGRAAQVPEIAPALASLTLLPLRAEASRTSSR